ncbi:MAG: hypothetical protein U1D31_02555 [Patescibacteria group bacterium]|nr:hypothetical protein [bacterium]MDZ4240979.1 hypothetical protein [Patescibacteria group bacterium]
MEHFVCRGECKAVSDKPGVCETEECSHKGQVLELCVCEDGTHDVGVD